MPRLVIEALAVGAFSLLAGVVRPAWMLLALAMGMLWVLIFRAVV